MDSEDIETLSSHSSEYRGDPQMRQSLIPRHPFEDSIRPFPQSEDLAIQQLHDDHDFPSCFPNDLAARDPICIKPQTRTKRGSERHPYTSPHQLEGVRFLSMLKL